MSALSPFQAQAKLASLPASPEAVNYLMSLVNGANSEIPRYMALGRLEQMKQEMASNKPAQPPQGTVKDKIQQAVGIMALRGGQQQQAAQQMAQGAPQGMPVPANVPQPQMQPQSEEEQMPEMDVRTGAGGGLMHARIDPRMFDFAPGGIVSFAGETGSRVELGKEKPLTKEEREKLENELRMRKVGAEARAQALAEERAAADVAQEPNPVPTTVAQEPGPAPTGARAMTGKIGESAVPAQALPSPAPAAPKDGLDDESQFRKDLRGLAGVFTRTEEQKAKKKELDRLNLAGAPINYFLQSASDFAKNRAARDAANSGAGIASLQKEKPQLQGPRVLTGDAAAEQDRLAKAREAFNAPPVAAAPAAAAPRPPAAPAAPRPPAAPAAPAAPAPGLDQGVGALAKTLAPQVDATKVRAAYTEADPTVRSIEQIAEDQKKIYDLTGVGTYGTERRKQIANMRQEFEQSRPSTSEDVIDMIRAGIRPGAIAGAAGEYSGQLKREREARLSFSKAEDALNDAVERADEAIRSGKASDIVKTRDEERKAKADYKKAKVAVEQAVMTAESAAANQGLQAATQLETNRQTNLTNLETNRQKNLTDIQVANIREAAAKYGYNKPTEADRIFERYSEILKSGGQKAAEAFLADQARVRATVLGVKYEGQPEKKAAIELKVQEEVRKRVPNIDLKLQNPKLSPADRAKYVAARDLVEKDVRRKLRNATGDEEGGSGSEAPKRLSEEEYNKARPGTVFLAPDGSTRIKQ